MTSTQKKLAALVAAGVLLLGFAAAVSAYRAQRAETLAQIERESATDTAFVRPYSQQYGATDARVTISEFLDPGCEACAAVAPHVKAIVDAHPGQVKLVIRYAPLHEGADTAVLMLEAARKQGKYWETLQLMFDSQSRWASHHHPAPEKLYGLLPSVGLDMDRLRKEMQGMEVGHILQQDIADRETLDVRKTPTFFVNGKPLSRFGLRELQELVSAEVAAAYEGEGARRSDS